MMERQYHYLIAGFPDISIDQQLWISMPDFKEYLEAHLHPEDFKQVKYVLLQKDHQNLIDFLLNNKIEDQGAANFSEYVFTYPEDEEIDNDPARIPLPGYMKALLTKYSGEKELPGKESLMKTLDEGFYHFIMEHGNAFLKDYFGFDYDMRNLLTYQKTSGHGLDQRKFITTDNSFALHLESYAGKTLVKDPEFEHFEELIKYLEIDSFAEEEKKYDILIWRIIEDLNLFEYFNIHRVLGYLLQMLIIERWSSLDKEQGERKLRKIIDESLLHISSQEPAISGESVAETK